MFLTEMYLEEKSTVKDYIGHFDICSIVEHVKLGSDSKSRIMNRWEYIAIKFKDGTTQNDIIQYIVKCKVDEFVGMIDGYYILWFD